MLSWSFDVKTYTAALSVDFFLLQVMPVSFKFHFGKKKNSSTEECEVKRESPVNNRQSCCSSGENVPIVDTTKQSDIPDIDIGEAKVSENLLIRSGTDKKMVERKEEIIERKPEEKNLYDLMLENSVKTCELLQDSLDDYIVEVKKHSIPANHTG